MEVRKHIELLGLKVRDRVTEFEGVVSSIGFDLYGCVQACVNPGLGKDGKLADSFWFDINRLEVLSKKPVMSTPNFEYGEVARGDKGADSKPVPKP